MVSQSREAAYCSFWLDLVQFFLIMKKSFILTVLLMVVALVPMQAFNVTVSVDDASKLT